ncbi:TonB-dependent receptor [Dysgonomonadaceae bacterium zrk40]|nr:TonB-dependent receptor [Dysgonomonadaceae bacterium zrk40]
MKGRNCFTSRGIFMLLFGMLSVTLFAQNLTVRGTVTDESGMTVIGATIIVEGDASRGTVTDIDGNYTLEGVQPNGSLRISYVGMKSQVIPVNGREIINVVLLSDTELLDELVVVGFGTQRKENLTGAVSAVSADDLTARPVNNVVEALQGIVPGMNITTGANGGALNATQRFNIRGIGTIGTGSSVSPLVLIDGMEGDMNTLNPNDIENISVLKDAAASSIYGSRAPGGVILITTKKGKSGKPSINYNNSFRFLSPLNMPEMADSYNFALAVNDQLGNGGQAPMYSENKLQQILDFQQGKSTQFMWERGGRWNSFDDPERQDIMPAGNTDWLKTHFGNSFTQEHALSINGGNDVSQYYFSGNYLDQGGLLNYGDDSKKRYTVTARLNSQLSDWLEMGYTARFSRSDYQAPSFTGGDDISWNVFYFDLIRYWPVIPVKDPNGYYTAESKVYQIQDGGHEKIQNDVFTQQLSFRFEPVEKWITNVELNYKTGNYFRHRDWQTAYAYDVDEIPYAIANQTTGVNEYAYKSNFFNPNIYSEYSRELGEGHNIKGMAGFQAELYTDRNLSGSQDNIAAGIPTLNTTTTNARTGGGYGHWATAGYFGRVNYDYKGRYLLEANLRYDGTSRFLEDQRWNLFPSFSAGWNVAREDFFEDYTDIISNLKPRVSWGQLGNQNTDNWYPFYRVIGRGNANGGWLLDGKRPNTAWESSLVSALLTWEKTETLNVGVDLSMFRNRFNATFDWFQRKSIDMVGPAPELPHILGIATPRVNNLDMKSKGWELQLIWRDMIEEFRYGASLSLSDNTVTIDRYPNESKSLSTYYPGAMIGDIWGYETIGIAQTNEEMQSHLSSMQNGAQSALGSNWGAGDIMYRDLNGDGKIDGGRNTVEDSGDRRIIGNSNPRYNFGLNMDAAYKGFDLKLFFQGTLKRDYMPGSGTTLFWGAVGYWQTNFFEPHLDYFRPADTKSPLGPNLDAYYPRPLENGRNRVSQTRFLQNAAYARLKNVTLGYTLPENITGRFAVNNLRLFVSGENLFTLTGLKIYDPETAGIGGWDGATYPLSKSLSVGLNVTL